MTNFKLFGGHRRTFSVSRQTSGVYLLVFLCLMPSLLIVGERADDSTHAHIYEQNTERVVYTEHVPQVDGSCSYVLTVPGPRSCKCNCQDEFLKYSLSFEKRLERLEGYIHRYFSDFQEPVGASESDYSLELSEEQLLPSTNFDMERPEGNSNEKIRASEIHQDVTAPPIADSRNQFITQFREPNVSPTPTQQTLENYEILPTKNLQFPSLRNVITTPTKNRVSLSEQTPQKYRSHHHTIGAKQPRGEVDNSDEIGFIEEISSSAIGNNAGVSPESKNPDSTESPLKKQSFASLEHLQRNHHLEDGRSITTSSSPVMLYVDTDTIGRPSYQPDSGTQTLSTNEGNNVNERDDGSSREGSLRNEHSLSLVPPGEITESDEQDSVQSNDKTVSITSSQADYDDKNDVIPKAGLAFYPSDYEISEQTSENEQTEEDEPEEESQDSEYSRSFLLNELQPERNVLIQGKGNFENAELYSSPNLNKAKPPTVVPPPIYPTHRIDLIDLFSEMGSEESNSEQIKVRATMLEGDLQEKSSSRETHLPNEDIRFPSKALRLVNKNLNRRKGWTQVEAEDVSIPIEQSKLPNEERDSANEDIELIQESHTLTSTHPRFFAFMEKILPEKEYQHFYGPKVHNSAMGIVDVGVVFQDSAAEKRVHGFRQRKENMEFTRLDLLDGPEEINLPRSEKISINGAAQPGYTPNEASNVGESEYAPNAGAFKEPETIGISPPLVQNKDDLLQSVSSLTESSNEETSTQSNDRNVPRGYVEGMEEAHGYTGKIQRPRWKKLEHHLSHVLELNINNIEREKQPPLYMESNCVSDGCLCVRGKGYTKSGIYYIPNIEYSGKRGRLVNVFCEMEDDGGGWTVIQRRVNGTANFYRDWEDYAHGFGFQHLSFWIGNRMLHAMTRRMAYELRVDFTNWHGHTGFAKYGIFNVGPEDSKFRLNLGNYRDGNRGNALSYHSNVPFSTKDSDNDRSVGHCAQLRQAGFWFKDCNKANPNGRWVPFDDAEGLNGAIITWGTWGKLKFSHALKDFRMMVRPILSRD